MRLKLWVLPWSVLWAQGWENIRDSLLIENERIEVLDLDQRPFPDVPKLERPVWQIESPTWEGIPFHPGHHPAPLQPTKPTWTKRSPLHVTYGLGRFWTHSLGANWGRTRDLRADEGVSLTHYSTSKGHVPQARWGYTHLSGWIGRYSDKNGWEASYRGGYERFIFYAPFAEGWDGFKSDSPIPDSLRGHYFRQELRLRLFDRNKGEVRLETRRLDFRQGGPEWQGILAVESRPLQVARWRSRLLTELFVEGRRFLAGGRVVADRVWGSWQVRLGLYIAGGRDSLFRLVAVPVGRLLYDGISPALRPYLELQGNLQPLTYYAASEINPYLRRESSILPLIREWINAQGGMRGQGAGWEYRLALEYRLIQGAPLFQPKWATFSLRGIPNFQSIGAVLQGIYAPNPEGLYFEWRATYRQWRTSETYFGLSPWEGWTRIGYQKPERFTAILSLYSLGRRSLAPALEGAPFVDISWEVHVQFLPYLSIFAEMNNLLNQRFYRWHGYIERPIDFRLGLWIKLG
ncbi:MAG: hypothetical protein N3E49_03930 [Bacteroidia bacterium]|nr:hypothetical protein [Bacteroidia bacterium]